MNLKLGKSFPLLKFKPNILQPLKLNLNLLSNLSFNINDPINTFEDIMKIDCILSYYIEQTKQSIKNYISSIQELKIQEVKANKEKLRKNLQVLVEIIQKLHFENLQRNISTLFKGKYGLYSLYRYVWSPDLLNLLCKVKSWFQQKDPKVNDPQIIIYAKKAQKYCQAIENVMHMQAKSLLKEFVSQMYIVSEQMGSKLARQANFDNKILSAFDHENQQERLIKLLSIYNEKSTYQIPKFKLIVKALLYSQLQTQFYPYLTFMKAILLNKVSGMFTGDYEVWERIYEISLKVYARKENLRGKRGIQIDQLIERQSQDPEFTQFLLKSQPESIQLCSILFYFKNCPISAKAVLRPVIFQKIKNILELSRYEEYEDMIEYLETEASAPQKPQIFDFIKESLEISLQKGIHKNQYFYFQKGMSDLIQYLLKQEQKFFHVVTENLLQKMFKILKANDSQDKDKRIIVFIYNFMNIFLMNSYQDEFEINKYLQEKKRFINLVQKIFVTLKTTYDMQIHQNGLAVLLEWKRIARDQNDSDSEGQTKEQEEKEQYETQYGEIIATLMITSEKYCDFKLESCLSSEDKREIVANEITKMFKILSDSEFLERKEIEKFLQLKSTRALTLEQKLATESFLVMKGLKDRLLHENILGLGLKLHPTIAFSQVAHFAVQFLTFMCPTIFDDPLPIVSNQQCTSFQPFDICDVISGDQPIQCMKLIYKKLPELEESMLNFSCFNKLPVEVLKKLGACSNSRIQLAKHIVQMQNQIDISTFDQVQEFKKFLFYVELMTKVFNKLNEKSQKGIKEIKVIFTNLEKVCYKVWQSVINKVISSEVFATCQESFKYKEKIQEMMENSPVTDINAQLSKQVMDFSQVTFNQLAKSTKLPYIDSILVQGNYITKISQQFICSLSKILHPTTFKSYYEKLYNPLQIIRLEKLTQKKSQPFLKNYQFIGEIVKVLGMIQYTCSNEEEDQNINKEQYKQWSSKWRKNCNNLTSKLLENINKWEGNTKSKVNKENESKDLWVSVFLVHLKAEIIKILFPFIIKNTLKYPQQNPKNYSNQLEETFTIFSTLCQIVEKISTGQQQHLMTFLQLFESYDMRSSKNININFKTSEFLYKAIQTLLDLVFKGIRVRSYHFYKFIKSYLKLTKQKQNYLFFNSVIAYHINNLIKQIVPQFKLPETILNFCDENMNDNSIRKSNNSTKGTLINEENLRQSVNKIRFGKFVRFEPKFELAAEKICVISMFINLFCRLNFKSLTEGIEKIWQTKNMHLVYIQYLKQITHLVSNELKKTDQKLLDILNVDCFGNLSLILRDCLHQNKKKNKHIVGNQEEKHKIIYQLLKLIKEVLKSNIRLYVKNSLELPVKNVMNQIKNSTTSTETIDYISESISKLKLSMEQNQKQGNPLQSASPCTQILDMIITCYNTKLTRGISSNIHLNNIAYICQNSELKIRMFEHNMSSLEKRMNRKDIRNTLQTYNKKQQPQMTKGGRRSSINKKIKPQDNKNIDSDNNYETWVKISKHSQNLMKQIVQNFVKNYQNLYKVESTQSCSKKISTLFNNLKILTVVTLNNPQIIKYLMNYRTNQQDPTVYEVMMDAAEVNLPVFAQLYLVFLKTNYSYIYVIENGVRKLMPYSFHVEKKTKSQILNRLQVLLRKESSGQKLQELLKTCEFITKIANSTYKPNLRSYKFGNIVNYTYIQVQSNYQSYFFKKLAFILKQGLLSFNRKQKQIGSLQLRVLGLYEEVLNKVLQSSDLAWMKLNLDIKLKQLKNNPKLITEWSINLKENQLNALINQEEDQEIIVIQNKDEYSTEECIRQVQWFVNYNFENEIINEEVYNILHRIDCKSNNNENSLRILQKLMEYSAKQSVWDGLPDEDTLLLNYPNDNSANGSFGLTTLGSERSQDSLIQLNPQSQNQPNLDDGIIQSDCVIQTDGIIENDQQQIQPNHNFDAIAQNIEEPQIMPIPLRPRTNGAHQQQELDEIMQEIGDCIIQEDPLMVLDQLKECMSETSLHFLSQHSVQIIEDEPQQRIIQQQAEVTKQHLLDLYEQSTINPQARKLLLIAINQADAVELQKFISNQSVDEEIEMIVVRELWNRGVVPSATSINKNNKYYANLHASIKTAKALNLYVNQAIVYKKMYDDYQKKVEIDPTQAYIPIISKETLQKVIISYFVVEGNSKNAPNSLWKIANKLTLSPINCYNLIQSILKYLSLTQAQITQRVEKIMGEPIKLQAGALKRQLINDILSGCIKDKVGLNLLLSGCWNCKSNEISNAVVKQQQDQDDNEIRMQVPILQFILNQSSLVQQTLSNHTVNKQTNLQSNQDQISKGIINLLWNYLQTCDQFKIQNNHTKQHHCHYPYYQIQETIKISQNVVRKIVDKLFTDKKIIGSHPKKQTSELEKLFLIMIYLDPTCFELYFKIVIEKMSQKLNQIIKKEQKILASFTSSWNSTNDKDSIYIEMEKEQKYWNLRQSKKSFNENQENLEFFRNILVDASINLLPKFKKIRFNFHCGKSYREWKLEIQILKEKLLSFGSIEGLVKLEQKQRELQEWKRTESNKIINQQIIPIFEEHSYQFLQILLQAEIYISEFVETFELKDQKQKIVVYNTCSKLYEILLASQILTHEEKVTYHSMSNLKTVQSIESTKNVSNVSGFGRRKSSLQNRKSLRLSINPCMPKVENLLRKIGPSCTYLNIYLGPQEEIRELHAKYSDVNKRLKVLWATRQERNGEKSQKEKIIECRRDHILQDTLCQIDDDFINLPIKIKFEGEIGVDYGGVTRQWITLFMKQIINPDLGLFSLSANKLTFQPNKNSQIIPNHLRYFKKIGILVGKAMKQNWLLQVNLTKSFLKHILGSTLYVEDLEDIDPETAKSLKWILENDIGYDDDLGLNFTYQNEKLGKKQTIQLIPGGALIPITEQNKKKYVKMLANVKMTEQIRDQTKAFMSGLEAVIPYSTLSLFSYKEISLYLSGMPTIDIAQMKQSARYENFTAESQQIVWFWSIISEWSQEELANFLFFLTGSYKVPYGGFKQHPIGFNKLVSCSDYLPVAHTCFSVVDLSEYSSKQKMSKLLKKSIKEGKGFSVS